MTNSASLLYWEDNNAVVAAFTGLLLRADITMVLPTGEGMADYTNWEWL